MYKRICTYWYPYAGFDRTKLITLYNTKAWSRLSICICVFVLRESNVREEKGRSFARTDNRAVCVIGMSARRKDTRSLFILSMGSIIVIFKYGFDYCFTSTQQCVIRYFQFSFNSEKYFVYHFSFPFCFGFRVSDFGFRVSGFGFRVSGFGFQVSNFPTTKFVREFIL
jgi:hypothetical protein